MEHLYRKYRFNKMDMDAVYLFWFSLPKFESVAFVMSCSGHVCVKKANATS